jgi:hypothetical protein
MIMKISRSDVVEYFKTEYDYYVTVMEMSNRPEGFDRIESAYNAIKRLQGVAMFVSSVVNVDDLYELYKNKIQNYCNNSI